MKLAVLSTVVALGIASTDAYKSPISEWKPRGPNDVRAPCPMLNSLANHGFLPRSGKSITADNIIYALNTALNVSEGLSRFLFDFAVGSNPVANSSTFDLDHLGIHNILEHDASLSRVDFALSPTNDVYTFNSTVFAETTSYWGDETITLAQAAAARIARIQTSNATNPDFSLSELGDNFSVGENAILFLLFPKDVEAITADRRPVQFLFENEKLPYELGWKTPQTVTTQEILFQMMDRVVNATVTSPAVAHKMLKRADLHSGRR